MSLNAAPDWLFTESATSIARRIREGDISSVDAVNFAIAKMESVNPRLNALVKDRFSLAREEAAAADARLKNEGPNDLPPFHGVPCTIKESIALEGMPHTVGLHNWRHQIAEKDAPVTERYRRAGAIPLGVTNTSEAAMWMESFNPNYGRTSNPYDARRHPGGSSGGEGAVIGAGIVPFGVGSDVGGSIRMPAFFCGVFGHKPTPGLIPNIGQLPPVPIGAHPYLGTGPLCRKAEDLYPLLLTLKGAHPDDPYARDMDLADPVDVDLSKVRMLYSETNHTIGVSKDLLAAQRKAASHLSAQGMTLEFADYPEFRRTLEFWGSGLEDFSEGSFSEILGNGEHINPLLELGKFFFGASNHTLPAIGLAIMEKLPTFSPVAIKKNLAELDDLRQRFLEQLGDDAVLLFPSHTDVALRHYQPLLKVISWMYTAIFNALHVPVTQVPLGLDNNGIPLGVQVVTSPGNDHLSIAVALELERAYGGWVPPWKAHEQVSA